MLETQNQYNGHADIHTVMHLIEISGAAVVGLAQQKIVIAKWLETKPRLLLMDEPTAGVDIGAKDEILNIVRNYVATGNSCLFISSEMSEMMAICDRILILNEGHISGEIDRTSLLSDEEEILENAIQQ